MLMSIIVIYAVCYYVGKVGEDKVYGNSNQLDIQDNVCIEFNRDSKIVDGQLTLVDYQDGQSYTFNIHQGNINISKNKDVSEQYKKLLTDKIRCNYFSDYLYRLNEIFELFNEGSIMLHQVTSKPGFLEQGSCKYAEWNNDEVCLIKENEQVDSDFGLVFSAMNNGFSADTLIIFLINN